MLLCLLCLIGCAEQPAKPVKADLRKTFSIPQYRNPLDPQTHEKWLERDRVIERVSFQGRYGDRIPALIVYSELAYAQPLPVILCMPGSPNVKEDLFDGLNIMRSWADNGFFVLSIDRPYHGNRVGNLKENLLEKGMVRVWGESLYDLMCALDYTEHRPEADADRVGMLGLSMGGMEALWLAALDQRVDVVVSVAGHLVWEDVFTSGAWKQIFRGYGIRNLLVQKGIDGKDAQRTFFNKQPQLESVGALSLVHNLVPRPLLLMVGDRDPFIPLSGTKRLFHAAERAYSTRGENLDQRLSLFVSEGGGHSFNREMQHTALEWFSRWLVDDQKSRHAD